MRRLVSALALLALHVGPLHAQDSLRVPDKPPEWGEVSKERLRVDDYPADSNASAVIISDVGKGQFKNDLEFVVQHHARIKILSEDGYDHGTVTIPFYAEGGTQQVDDIQGQTYTLDESGSIRTRALDDDDVFEEELEGGYKQMRFTLPNLEPGAVIEYRYELGVENWQLIPSWSFQHGEPTLYSEYRMHIPGALEYVTLTTGTQKYDTVDSKGHRGTGELEKWWIMTEVPALREEPFMTTLEDYRSRLRFQLKAFRNPATGAVEKRFMSSWPDVAESMLEADYFGKNLGEGGGGLFGGEGAVETQVEQITGGVESDSAKMHALYEYVQSSVGWNQTVSRGRNKEFDEILETQTGNSAEVNLLLVSLLQNAGVEAHPVLLSTRNHGQMYPPYPFVRQFNTVIAAVDLPTRDDRVLLNATEPLCPASMLPERNLNRRGWLVRKNNPKWIPIRAPGQTQRDIFVKGTLRPDGTLAATIDVTDHGYRALESRRVLQDKEAPAFIREDLLSNVSEVSISDATVSNWDVVDRPLRIRAKIEVPGHARTAGTMIYLNPQIAPFFSENPLKRKDRSFPVDFAHPRTTTYTLSLRMPEGYQIADVPSSLQVHLPNQKGQYLRQSRAQVGQLTLRSTMEIRSSHFPPKRYGALRELFSRVVSEQSKQIVVEEKPGTATPSSSGNKR